MRLDELDSVALRAQALHLKVHCSPTRSHGGSHEAWLRDLKARSTELCFTLESLRSKLTSMQEEPLPLEPGPATGQGVDAPSAPAAADAIPEAPAPVEEAPMEASVEMAPDEEADAPGNGTQETTAFHTAEASRIAADRERLAAYAETYERGMERLASAGPTLADAGGRADAALADLDDPGAAASSMLRSRFDSAQILRRMVARLVERSAALAAPERVSLDLPPPGPMPSCEASIESLESYGEAESQARYAAITEIRRGGEAARKALIDFLGKYALPVVDALDDGGRYARELPNDAADEYAARIVAAYSKAREAMVQVLSSLGLCEVAVAVGEPIDYERHEPFDVEEDPGSPNESVKEVFRAGYALDDGYLIRPAQVIVVRNPGEGGA